MLSCHPSIHNICKKFNENISDVPENIMKACRICLSKDGRLYPITSNELLSLYHQLTGLPKLEINVEGRLPQWVCAECGLRLLTYNKLRQKSLTAHQILTDLLDEVNHITEEDINQIDREKNGLKSNLSYNVLDNAIIHKYEVNIQQTEQTDSKPKPNPKIKEFVIDLEGTDTARIFKTETIDDCISEGSDSENFETNNIDVENTETFDDLEVADTEMVLKTERDSFDDCNPESVSSNTENETNNFEINNTEAFESDKDTTGNFDVEDACLSPDSIDFQPFTTNVLKIKNKYMHLDVQKDIDNCANRINVNNESNKTTKAKRVKESKKVKNSIVDKSLTKRKKRSQKYDIKDGFTIETLSQEEQISEFEQRMFARSYTVAPFTCNICFKGFVNKHTFAKHMSMHSDKYGTIECNICKLRFLEQRHYINHLECHKTRYSCKQCQFVSNSRHLSLQHWLKHKGKVYKCPHCDADEFVNFGTYSRHLKIKHVSQFVCEFCGYSFVSAYGVKQHKNVKHSSEMNKKNVTTDSSPTCETCKIRFVSSEALRTHLQVSHNAAYNAPISSCSYSIQYNKTKKTICELCGVVTKEGSRGYLRHFRIYHPDEKPGPVHSNRRTKVKPATPENSEHICDQCGLVFKVERALKQHQLMHTGEKPFECDDCHKKYPRKVSLIKHIVTKHLPKKNSKYLNMKETVLDRQRFPCDICGKLFTKPGNRKRHMVERQRCPCEVCGKTFAKPANRKRHMLIHTDPAVVKKRKKDVAE